MRAKCSTVTKTCPCVLACWQAGFERIRENEAWRGKLRAGGRYFYTRNQTSLIAFAVGQQFQKSDRSGFTIIGAHTDSPCPK